MNEPIQITCLCAHERGEQQSGKQMAHRVWRIIYRLLGHAIIVKRVISRNKRARACPITARSPREKRSRGRPRADRESNTNGPLKNTINADCSDVEPLFASMTRTTEVIPCPFRDRSSPRPRFHEILTNDAPLAERTFPVRVLAHVRALRSKRGIFITSLYKGLHAAGVP